MDKEGVFPRVASSFHEKDIMLFQDNYPCKIVEVNTSKTGKHGSCKITYVGTDIFTGKKYEEMSQSTKNMYEVIVKKQKYQVLAIEDGVLSLIDEKDNEIEMDIKDPKTRRILNKTFNALKDNEELWVTVMRALDQENIFEWKVSESKK